MKQFTFLQEGSNRILSKVQKSFWSCMLRYLKHNGNQSHPCRIKLFLFFAVPSTMNNQDPKSSAPPKDYTSIGTILDPKLATQDCKLAQTPIDPTTGLLHHQQYGRSSCPNEPTLNDSNEAALNIHEYTSNILCWLYKDIIFITNISIFTHLLSQ